MNTATASLSESIPQSYEDSITILSNAFLRHFPRDAARKLEFLPAQDAAAIITAKSPLIREKLWPLMTPAAASLIVINLDDDVALEVLAYLDAAPCAALLSRLNHSQRDYYLSLMPKPEAAELRELLDYPKNTAGYMMDTQTVALNRNTSVAQTIEQLRRYPAIASRRIYTLDSGMRLQGQVELERLVTADPETTLADLSNAIVYHVEALAPKEEVSDILQKNNLEMLPVVDVHQRLVGVIRGASAIEVLKEDIAADLQTMVGVSREERALSSSWFAVRKRQGWLQINLLTGFLAAAVVSLFESTIAQFTALAILMPVAAGQSGNTGAQALAVTMRGLTLREITMRHWLQVVLKEACAGLLNGLAIALTCGIGVYIWSQSFGLALVIALAMVISMTIAGISGALVPIVLKRLGQDPAQSSSIVLTTITDIAGFMSFLGIATILSSLLF